MRSGNYMPDAVAPARLPLTRWVVALCASIAFGAIAVATLMPPSIYQSPMNVHSRWVGDWVVFDLDAIKTSACMVGGQRRPFIVVDRDFTRTYSVYRDDGTRVMAARRNIQPGETLRIRGFRFRPDPADYLANRYTLHAPCHEPSGRARVADLGPLPMPSVGHP